MRLEERTADFRTTVVGRDRRWRTPSRPRSTDHGRAAAPVVTPASRRSTPSLLCQPEVNAPGLPVMDRTPTRRRPDGALRRSSRRPERSAPLRSTTLLAVRPARARRHCASGRPVPRDPDRVPLVDAEERTASSCGRRSTGRARVLTPASPARAWSPGLALPVRGPRQRRRGDARRDGAGRGARAAATPQSQPVVHAEEDAAHLPRRRRRRATSGRREHARGLGRRGAVDARCRASSAPAPAAPGLRRPAERRRHERRDLRRRRQRRAPADRRRQRRRAATASARARRARRPGSITQIARPAPACSGVVNPVGGGGRRRRRGRERAPHARAALGAAARPRRLDPGHRGRGGARSPGVIAARGRVALGRRAAAPGRAGLVHRRRRRSSRPSRSALRALSDPSTPIDVAPRAAAAAPTLVDRRRDRSARASPRTSSRPCRRALLDPRPGCSPPSGSGSASRCSAAALFEAVLVVPGAIGVRALQLGRRRAVRRVRQVDPGAGKYFDFEAGDLSVTRERRPMATDRADDGYERVLHGEALGADPGRSTGTRTASPSSPGVAARARRDHRRRRPRMLRRSQDRLWDDEFIELCDDWAVPYIGDLVGHAARLRAQPRAAGASTSRRRSTTAAARARCACSRS